MKYDEQRLEVFEQLWCIGLSCAWSLVVLCLLANAFGHGNYFGGLLAMPFWGIVSRQLKKPAIAAARWHFLWAKQQAERRGKMQFEAKISGLQAKSDEEQKRATVARWKSEIINTYLGPIDGYLRVLQDEADTSRRIVTLQSAYSKLMTLKAECTAGEIPQEVLTDRAILDHAQETSNELTRLGFAEDRLNQELRRLFRLA